MEACYTVPVYRQRVSFGQTDHRILAMEPNGILSGDQVGITFNAVLCIHSFLLVKMFRLEITAIHFWKHVWILCFSDWCSLYYVYSVTHSQVTCLFKLFQLDAWITPQAIFTYLGYFMTSVKPVCQHITRRRLVNSFTVLIKHFCSSKVSATYATYWNYDTQHQIVAHWIVVATATLKLNLVKIVILPLCLCLRVSQFPFPLCLWDISMMSRGGLGLNVCHFITVFYEEVTCVWDKLSFRQIRLFHAQTLTCAINGSGLVLMWCQSSPLTPLINFKPYNHGQFD